MATAEEYHAMSEAEKKKEDWMNSKWRPMMGWMYMLVCTSDFVLFPILWSLVQVIGGGRVETQWQPITLQGAGLFHIAMGAVLGIAAFGRTHEKLGDKAGGTMSVPSPAPYTPPPAPAPVAFTPPPVVAAKPIVPTPVVSTSGKPGPAPAPEPEL
jgi:hypothetical protein